MESAVPPGPVWSATATWHQRRGPSGSSITAIGGRVLVLNATYEPINVCTVRRAVVLLLKEKAELIERSSRELHSESTTLARPVVIRLITYVNVPRDAHRRKITRRAVFARAARRSYSPTARPSSCSRLPSRQRAPTGAPFVLLL